MSFSKLDQVLYVNLKSFFKPGKHVLIAGTSGSGKTSTLLLLTGLYYDNKDTIIWRDDSSLEFLSLADEIPIKVFIPKNCTLYYKHPNVTYVEYDPRHILSILNRIDRDKINTILYDLFCFEMKYFLEFWKKFFYALYKWKRTRIKTKLAFITDELNDLCPGTRRGYIPKQLSLASNIYFSMKKFRKEKIKLIATTHNLTDLHKPVRDSFNYYFIRHMRREAVPERFWNYTQVIEGLGINQAIVVDEVGAFNRINVPLYVEPKNFNLNFDGDIEETIADKKSEAKWKERTVRLAKFLLENKYVATTKDLGDILGITQSTAWKLVNEEP